MTIQFFFERLCFQAGKGVWGGGAGEGIYSQMPSAQNDFYATVAYSGPHHCHLIWNSLKGWIFKVHN